MHFMSSHCLKEIEPIGFIEDNLEKCVQLCPSAYLPNQNPLPEVLLVLFAQCLEFNKLIY